MAMATYLCEFFETYAVLFNSRNCYIFKDINNKLSFKHRDDAIYRLCKDNHNMISII